VGGQVGGGNSKRKGGKKRNIFKKGVGGKELGVENEKGGEAEKIQRTIKSRAAKQHLKQQK